MENMKKQGGTCNCPHHKVVPISIMLIGLTFLLGAFGMLGAMAVNIIWPLLLIIIGGTKLGGASCACC